MEKKSRFGLNALLILGIVFSALGAVYAIVGAALWNAPGLEGDDALVGPIFCGLGGLFLVLGLIFLFVEVSKKKQADALIAEGRFLWGEITEFVPNYNVRINNRHPYIALVRYRDAAGITHIFRSRSLRITPDPSAIGKQVKVYFRDDSFKPYYVDMDGVLSQVIEH